MKSPRKWWLMFGLGAAAVIAALIWITAVVLRLESAELQARAQAQHQERIRLALWRMDSWLGPRLSREATRPYFEYLPFYAQQRAYTRILHAIEPGEVITPSPLLAFDSEFFPLHFQIDAHGQLTSPQTPAGNWRDLAEASYIKPGQIERKQPLLARVSELLAPVQLEACVTQAESLLASLVQEQPKPNVGFSILDFGLEGETQNPESKVEKQTVQSPQARESKGQAASKADLYWRAQAQQQSLEAGIQTMIEPSVSDAAIEIGPLVPLWLALHHQDQMELLFVRRVRINGQVIYQGMLGDWLALRQGLLEQVADVFLSADLTPITQLWGGGGTRELESGRMLASVPVALHAECPRAAAAAAITPARTTLGLTWLAVLAAIAAAGATLRASIAYGEKRSRFASAVTHELRTPLTTFRMYSEMLADGMVRDEQQRQTYLSTLKSESSRLAILVENVLSYARLEDGRAVAHAQETTVAKMLERLAPTLHRRAEAANMQLRIDNQADDSPIVIDVEVVGQILFNLVDNACKYTNGADNRVIDVTAHVQAGRLTMCVRDYGPGIASEHARVIFAPFERGAHNPGDTIPGVGLGLALCRGLARDMGGELKLESQAHCGACFRITLPT